MGQEISALMAAGFTYHGDVMEFSDAVANSKKIKSVDGVPVRELAEPAPESVHAWIDFSRPEATLRLLEVADSPVVIGTTGFSQEQLQKIEKYSQKIPILLSPNMSPGLNWLIKMLGTIPLPDKERAQLVLSEVHHVHKKDSPSGTLKKIHETLKKAGYPEPQIQVARAGEEKGTHTLTLFSEGEEITLTHRVMDRTVFAKGSLVAAHFLIQKKAPGLYSYQDVEEK
jgi:4-hydroxy-tetrahydrodipicolinate reductase